MFDAIGPAALTKLLLCFYPCTCTDSPISDLDSIASEESFLDGVNYPHPSPISSPAISPEPQMSRPVPMMDPDLQPDQEATIEITTPPVAVLIPRPAVTSHHSTLPGPLNVKGKSTQICIKPSQ